MRNIILYTPSVLDKNTNNGMEMRKENAWMRQKINQKIHYGTDQKDLKQDKKELCNRK